MQDGSPSPWGIIQKQTGADRLTDWKKEPADPGENVYSTPWPRRFIGWSKTGTHPNDDYHRLHQLRRV